MNAIKSIKTKLVYAMLGLAALLTVIGIAKPEIVRADETIEFCVQTAETNDDGTIRVVVYVNNAANLGGVDVELAYDADKVSYVNSGLGTAFNISLGTTNDISDESVVKCVAVFGSITDTNGELFYADFKPSAGESYQPKLNVVDVYDSSTDINPLSYSVTYQQNDGNWMDTPDESGKKADEKVVEEAKQKYGSGDVTFTNGNVVSSDLAGETSGDSADESGNASNNTAEGNADESNAADGDTDENADNDSDANPDTNSDKNLNETSNENTANSDEISDDAGENEEAVLTGSETDATESEKTTTGKGALWIIVIVIVIAVIAVAVIAVRKKSGGKKDEK